MLNIYSKKIYKSKLKNGNTFIKTKVYIIARSPCRSFPKIYGLADKSVLDIMLKTWRNIEIPPKPSKNAVNIIFIESFLQAIEDIKFIPLVISKNPVNNPEINEVSICIILNRGVNNVLTTFKTPLDFNIEIILEKITTKPPIKTIVEILLVILSDNTSPKFEKET